jgi:dihydrofolate synthase / folylpolyglutamate synthase
MAVSDAILTRLLGLHPKIIDLSLDRMKRILQRLGEPHEALPPVIHVAGTNGKGSTVAYLRAILEAAGLKVHAYTSPHLVKFHERIRLATGPGKSAFIPESELSALLEQCEAANGGEPITFFEITTAAAFLAFKHHAADYLLLEVGLGGRLDATNVIDQPRACVITSVDYDHQHYLGHSLTLIAREKAGILKRAVPCIVGRQSEEALMEIERCARMAGAPLSIANQDWSAILQGGRLVFQDEDGLLDLPPPRLKGGFQFDNAGNAIAAVRRLKERRIEEPAIAHGLRSADWPARMQRLREGTLSQGLGSHNELWLDGGHNPSAGQAIAAAFAELQDQRQKPLVLILGMLNSKDAAAYLRPFRGLAQKVITVAIPGEANAFTAEELARAARGEGLVAEPAPSIETAVRMASEGQAGVRLLICGSLYLAGNVLALHRREAMSEVSGAARR